MNVLQSRVTIYEDRCTFVPLLGQGTLQLSNETNLREYHLINGDVLAQSCCYEHLTCVLFPSPRYLSHGTIEAYSTCWWLDTCKFLGDLIVRSEVLELGKREVAKTMMPAHQLSLIVCGDVIDTVSRIQRWSNIKHEWAHTCELAFLLLLNILCQIARGSRDIIMCCSLRN